MPAARRALLGAAGMTDRSRSLQRMVRLHGQFQDRQPKTRKQNMTTKLKVENPDAVEMTLTLTMPLGQWRRLKEQLGNAWPAWDVGSAIREMITKAETHFEAKVKEGASEA